MTLLCAPAALLLVCAAAFTVAAQAEQHCKGPTSLPSTRFQDNGDGTVTDLDSKLMWMRCATGQQWRGQRCVGSAEARDWAAAMQYADKLSRDGGAFFNDWRLPTLRELATITDRSCHNPRTNLAVFPDTPAVPFWSATVRPGEAAGDRAMALSFGVEGVVTARKHERLPVRLVRTGP